MIGTIKMKMAALILLCLTLFLTTCHSSSNCTWNTTVAILDEEHNTYLIKPGFDCPQLQYMSCVTNAYCNTTCHCRNGFYANSEGLCVHGFEGPCMANSDCDNADKGLECGWKGQCNCPVPDQFYNESDDKCLARYGHNCSEAVACASNFVCRNDFCWCPEGQSLAKGNEKCSNGLGATCGKQEDCDQSRLLFCFDGRCQCHGLLQEYSLDLGMCVGLDGAVCNRGSGRGHYTNLSCGEGMSCKSVDGNCLVGICRKSGSVIEMVGKYLAILGVLLFIAICVCAVCGHQRPFTIVTRS